MNVEKTKALVVEREEVASQMEFKTNGKIMEFAIPFKCLGNCLSNFGVLQEDMKIRACEGLKTFVVMKVLFNVRNVSLSVKKELY